MYRHHNTYLSYFLLRFRVHWPFFQEFLAAKNKLAIYSFGRGSEADCMASEWLVDIRRKPEKLRSHDRTGSISLRVIKGYYI